MKILYITHAYPPYSTGGTEISTHAVAKRMQSAGHLVHVLCAGNWGEGANYWNGEFTEATDGVPVTRLQINWSRAPDPCRYLYDNPDAAAYLTNYLYQYCPDIVHVTSCVTLSSSVLSATAEFGCPLILTLTDFWFICPQIQLIKGNHELCDSHVQAVECLKCMLWNTKAYQWPRRIFPESTVERLLTAISRKPKLTRQTGLRGMALDMEDRRKVLSTRLKSCDRIIVKSAYVRNIFAAHGTPKDKLTVLPDGEDTQWSAQLALLRQARADTPVMEGNPVDLSNHSLRVGYLGHIVHPKGVHVLIQAFKQLSPGAELHIYGDFQHAPEYSQWLQQLSDGNNRITFKGKYARARLPAIMAGLDVLVVPSIWPETFNHVIREGFIARIPVVASGIGAIPEIITDGVNGFLFPPGDSQALQHRLQQILDHPEILKSLSANIPVVKNIDQHHNELVELYQQVLHARAARPRQPASFPA